MVIQNHQWGLQITNGEINHQLLEKSQITIGEITREIVTGPKSDIEF